MVRPAQGGSLIPPIRKASRALQLRRSVRGIEPLWWLLFALAGALALSYLATIQCFLDGC